MSVRVVSVATSSRKRTETLAARLFAFRDARGYTLEQAAALLNLGVATIWKIENGRSVNIRTRHAVRSFLDANAA